MKYIRLLRLPDQYLQGYSALAAGFFLHLGLSWIIWWVLGLTFLSCTAFMVNELVDRGDVDRFSWNPIHTAHEKFNMQIVWAEFLLLSALGLYICFAVGLFWWGLLSYLVGIGYSIKPVRFKARFGLDMLAQLFIWWMVPFAAPIILVHGHLGGATSLIICISLLAWSGFFAYQLADYTADLNANLHSTHIGLGPKASLYTILIFGVIGLVLYFVIVGYREFWSLPIAAICLYAMLQSFKWLTIKKQSELEVEQQNYIKIVKPLSQLMFISLLIIWILFV